MAVNPTTNRIYVANETSNNVSVIDGATNTVVATVTVGVAPSGVAVNPTTNRIYVANCEQQQRLRHRRCHQHRGGHRNGWELSRWRSGQPHHQPHLRGQLRRRHGIGNTGLASIRLLLARGVRRHRYRREQVEQVPRHRRGKIQAGLRELRDRPLGLAKRRPREYGAISFADSVLSIVNPNPTRVFPFVWTRWSPLPPAGDFSLELRVKFDQVGPSPTSIVARGPTHFLPGGTNSPWTDQVFTIGQDSDANPLNVQLLGQVAPVTGTYDTDWHTYRLDYVAGSYSAFVDDALRLGPLSSDQIPNSIWFGNPAYTYWGAAISTTFSIDYIRVDVSDGDGDGVPDFSVQLPHRRECRSVQH